MTALVPNVTGADVAAAMNRGTDAAFAVGLADTCAQLAREAAASYTRGEGFTDADQVPASLRWVILLRAIRISTNYLQLQSQATDGASINYGAGAFGWTVHELKALDELRRTWASI